MANRDELKARDITWSQSLQCYVGSGRRLAYGRIEAARMLGISPSTVDRLVKRGLLKPSRALRRPLFTEAELNSVFGGNQMTVPKKQETRQFEHAFAEAWQVLLGRN